MRPADLTPIGRDPMAVPAGPGYIFATFVGAYLLALLPWSGWALLARPDFLLLVLVFWALHEPRAIGQGLAFALGLLMDVSDSMLLGQHAFAYVVAVYLAQVLRVRILAFHAAEQALHVAGLFAVSTAILVVLNLLLGADFPGFAVLASPVLAAAAWGPASWVLRHPAMRRRRSEVSS
jgi:rod shape-determining protein MreD